MSMIMINNNRTAHLPATPFAFDWDYSKRFLQSKVGKIEKKFVYLILTCLNQDGDCVPWFVCSSPKISPLGNLGLLLPSLGDCVVGVQLPLESTAELSGHFSVEGGGAKPDGGGITVLLSG